LIISSALLERRCRAQNRSNFDAGVYIIKVETTKGLETQKVAIK